MAISFIAEGIKKPKLKYRNVIFWIKFLILKYNNKVGELTYIFCDDNYLLDINYRFLRHDYYTDIVSFDYCRDGLISGDLFISIDRIHENSVSFHVPYEEELLRVIVHGLLHLLGFGDSNEEQKKKMRELENEYLLLYQYIENGCFK